MAKSTMTVIRGGRVLDIEGHQAPRADILIKGDTILEIGRAGLAAPDHATVIDAEDRLLHPGLVNGHTHSHGNLAKGMVDGVTLELLLTAGPYMTGARTLEDKYLSSLIGAAEMVLKGCTAAYDLAAEFPMPTAEGLAAIGQAYADIGIGLTDCGQALCRRHRKLGRKIIGRGAALQHHFGRTDQAREVFVLERAGSGHVGTGRQQQLQRHAVDHAFGEIAVTVGVTIDEAGVQ